MREMFDEPSTSQPGDERLYVKFYMGSTPDTAGTQREGRPMFKSVPFVKILVPGDRNTVIDTFADAKYKARFFDFPEFWLNSPCTYYWQAHRISCENGIDDCRLEGQTVKFKVR